MHEGHEPDSLGDLRDADRLAGKSMAQVDLAPAQADATAARDRDGAIVEGTRGWVGLDTLAVRRDRAQPGTSCSHLVRFLQRQMHPFVPTVLLRVAGLIQKKGPASGAFQLHKSAARADRQAATAVNCQFFGRITASMA